MYVAKILIRTPQRLRTVFQTLQELDALVLACVSQVREQPQFETGGADWYLLGNTEIVRVGHLLTFKADTIDSLCQTAKILNLLDSGFDLAPQWREVKCTTLS